MKFGYRTPSLSKSVKARTTGKIKRQAKSAINPVYGKKGMGWINDPKKAAYNKVYNKTTTSAFDGDKLANGCLAFAIVLFVLMFGAVIWFINYIFSF